MEIRVALKATDVRAEGERVTAAFKQWVDAGEGGRWPAGGAAGAGRWAALARSSAVVVQVVQSAGAVSPTGARSRARAGTRPTRTPAAALPAGCGGAGHWQLEPENYEGWRVRVAEGDGKEGWVLLRPSLHDPGAQRAGVRVLLCAAGRLRHPLSQP